jgi:hypothetical protein
MRLKTLNLNSSVIIQNNQLNQDNKLLSFLVSFLKFLGFLLNNANLYASLHLLLPFLSSDFKVKLSLTMNGNNKELIS